MNMDFTDYGTFSGMRIYVSRPVSVTIRRTWKERLFSRPWRPFTTTKVIIQPATIPANECYQFGNDLHCGDRFYENLKTQTKEYNHGQRATASSQGKEKAESKS